MPPFKGDPAQVIRDLHDLGAELGFERVRIDRSQYPVGAGGKPQCWYELGYAHGEIGVRVSNGSSLRFSVERADYSEMRQLLLGLIATTTPAEVKP